MAHVDRQPWILQNKFNAVTIAAAVLALIGAAAAYLLSPKAPVNEAVWKRLAGQKAACDGKLWHHLLAGRAIDVRNPSRTTASLYVDPEQWARASEGQRNDVALAVYCAYGQPDGRHTVIVRSIVGGYYAIATLRNGFWSR